ncbi:MAG: winged helix-turn-helix domain-containing protein [Vicinamibacterales bacterium]
MPLTFGPFVLDLDQRRLFRGGDELHLQPKAFELLRLLVEARPKALSKDAILTAVWPGTFVTENSLATVVRDLRTALGDDAQAPRYIRTAFGFGYAFVGDAAPAGPAVAASDWRLILDHREIVLREGETVLGRAGADVVVIDGPTVSRHHAVVRVTGDRAVVEDLGSKNGTWLDGRRLTAVAPLNDGAELRLGVVRLVVRLRRADPTTETAVSWGGPGDVRESL